MSVGYVYDPIYLAHDVPGHPESPGRLRAIMSHLESSGLLGRMVEVQPRDATVEEIARVHARALVERVKEAADPYRDHWLDVDTYVVAHSYEAALRAAGGLMAATDAVLDGEVDSAFALVRPPGHHATPTHAMGFCLFDNVAVAAAHLLESRGLARVAIVDFDVHHGNGTQDIFYRDGRVLYVSTHQYPFYPGTGYYDETGEGPGKGLIVNVPLPAGSGDETYLRAYREVCAPVLRRFRPELILVSAGFDAHFADPLAQMLVSTRGYYAISSLLRELAGELCEGRIVYALEGGYDHMALAWSVGGCVQTLLGEPLTEDPLGPGPSLRGPEPDAILAAVKKTHSL
ncbi:MAG TPA: histone deacetylase [Dehalococcoidia bacterium]|nr:histone deacetylase [Dehalococcoidia bacterium]